MSFGLNRQLSELHKKFSPQEFGRICQALLEIIFFRDLAFEGRGREVERPDIQAKKEGQKYNIEVKAQLGDSFSITQRDLDGVVQSIDEDYLPVIAVLDFGPDPQWLFLDANFLRPGTYNKIAVQIHLLEDLSNDVNSMLPEVLQRCFETALRGGSSALRSTFL